MRLHWGRNSISIVQRILFKMCTINRAETIFLTNGHLYQPRSLDKSKILEEFLHI